MTMNPKSNNLLTDHLYDRTCRLIGADALERIRKASVLVAGLGGVGGYIVENLVRAGVGTIGLCDYDRIEASNFNRQILATAETDGMAKTAAAALRCRSINPDVRLHAHGIRINEKTIEELSVDAYDCIADAIDDVPAKILLIQTAVMHGRRIVSAMGCGAKMDPFRFRIAPIEESHTCPLAKAVRKELRTLGISGVPVLFSDEKPGEAGRVDGCGATPSISYMPAIAGSMIAGQILLDLIG